jgi:hypothetical protein
MRTNTWTTQASVYPCDTASRPEHGPSFKSGNWKTSSFHIVLGIVLLFLFHLLTEDIDCQSVRCITAHNPTLP